MKHSVALAGSYSGGDMGKLLKSLTGMGIMQMTLVGREITLHVQSGNLDETKKSLNKLGVSNLSVLEWKKTGVTLSGSGRGTDNENLLNVSLIPSTLDEGLKPLAFLCEYKMDEKTVEILGARIEEILREAGVTDALYTVHIKDLKETEGLIEAVTAATLNAIFDAGGVVNID
ncbi:MAG: hypothetical protein JW724_06700 [Candidatus Altiarchaeota archaeon]|nr:hypothetical protein [Candidatus Altiarchaeota archaeon]